MQPELALRITVVGPPSDVVFALQRGKSELVAPSHATTTQLVFDLTVRVRDEGQPNFLGPFAQGPRAARFVYVNSGTSAGQADSPWTRRAKVPLSGITAALIKRSKGAVLEARIAGTSKDGGPACATVPLLDGGWRIARD